MWLHESPVIHPDNVATVWKFNLRSTSLIHSLEANRRQTFTRSKTTRYYLLFLVLFCSTLYRLHHHRLTVFCFHHYLSAVHFVDNCVRLLPLCRPLMSVSSLFLVFFHMFSTESGALLYPSVAYYATHNTTPRTTTYHRFAQ